MDDQNVERTLAECERALAGAGKPDLAAIGFWKAVGVVKRHPEQVARFADRIGTIDRETFERKVWLRFPAVVGVALDVLGIGIGVALLALAFAVSSPWRDLAILAGVGAMLVASHTLVHYVVGSAMGIRFTHWFSVPPLKPQPGFKTDYASYLRTPARARAWMHASGAIASKLVPLLVIPVAVAAGAEAWTVWALVAVGAISVLTDVLLSTKLSDWKRFRREMRAAR